MRAIFLNGGACARLLEPFRDGTTLGGVYTTATAAPRPERTARPRGRFNAAKEGGSMGFGGAQTSNGEKEMLDQVRAAVSQA